MLALLTCLLLLPGAYSIGVSFSAQGGGGSVGLNSIYNLDDSVSASEGASASFGQVGISDTRSVSGTGNVHQADQSYSGNGGYSGSASFSKLGSGSLTGSASLSPGSMSASQGVSVSGPSNAGMSVTNGGTADVNSNLVLGSMQASQSISTGSAHASSSTQFNGAIGSSRTVASSPGQGSASILSGYVLSNGVSASEISSASSNQVGITNTRSISGTGNINVFQGYSGSKGCSGSSNIDANGVSGALGSTVSLSPSDLSANQGASLTGDSVCASLNLLHQGDSLFMSSAMQSGTINTNQNVWDGNVQGSQTTSVLSLSEQIQLIAIINSLQKLINDLQSFSGNTPTSMTSSTTLNPNGNIQQSNSVKGKSGSYQDSQTQVYGDGSQSSVDFNIANAADYSYGFTRDDNKQEVGETLTADNAGIHADAFARNIEGDSSSSGIDITDGSIKGYSSKAQADKTSATTSQTADSASGNSVSIESQASNTEGDDVEGQFGASHLWDPGWIGSISSYSGNVKATGTSVDQSQIVGSATGDWVTLYQATGNKEGDNAEGALWIQGVGKQGCIRL